MNINKDLATKAIVIGGIIAIETFHPVDGDIRGLYREIYNH